jgi:hypothetical protein
MIGATAALCCTAVHAASVGVGRWTKTPEITTEIQIRGQIEEYDDELFRQKTANVRGTAMVWFDSPGGYVAPAINIGRLIHERGWWTKANRNGICASACVLILLAGKHVLVQRRTIIGIHATTTYQGDAAATEYLKEVGITDRQIRYILPPPQPDAYQTLTHEMWQMGFNPQVVFSTFGCCYEQCEARFCELVP